MGNDLEIEIRAGTTAGTWEVEVDSPAGTATGTMELDAVGILGRRRELAASVLASAVTSRSTFSTLERPVRDVGCSLFEALFAGRIYGRYTASLQQAGSRGEPLRVVLRIRDPELAGIPWEALFDAESGEYLCQREPVVRYVEAAQPSAPLAATGPLRILGLVAAPSDLATLDTAEERRRLDDALGELVDQGLVEMVWVDAGNWSALQQALTAGPWHVLHVIAHGGVGPKGGVIALEHEQTGNAAQVSARRFARLLHASRPVPRLVVLNSCSSGESAADDLLSSTAAALVHSGISAAVAMQFAVTDPAALAFSRGFYQALSRNIAVDEAVRLGRIAIDGTSEQTLEWVTPVIYLRTDDTRLFELTTTEAKPVPQQAPEEISNEAAKYGLYVQSLAAARKERYDEAAALLDSLITLDPSYRDAVDLRDRVRREQRLGASYAKARAAEETGNWETARRLYRSIIDVDPAHQDAQQRHDDAERRLLIVSLTDELKLHAGEEDWDDVLAVSAELARLDPEAADPDGLATKAREMTAPVQAGPTPAPVEKPPAETAPVETAPVETPPVEEAPVARGGVEDEPTAERPAVGADEPTDGLPLVRTQDAGPPGGGQPPTQDTPITPQPGPVPPPPSFPWAKVAAIGVPVLILLVGLGWWLLAGTHGQGDADDRVEDQTTGTVTCWDGNQADGSANCALPTGFAGLSTVFPSMDDSCGQLEPSISDKVELWECNYGDYVIRYSLWTDDADRYGYFDDHIENAETGDWVLEGETVGRTWTGIDDRENEERRFRAIATYENWPYDVTVKGVDEAARDEGIQRVQAKLPEQIGLP